MIWDYIKVVNYPCYVPGNIYRVLFVLLHSGPKESMLDLTQVCEKTNLNYIKS